MALNAVLAFVLAVLGLHTYIIVHLSGKFGNWHFIMNIMCCFSSLVPRPVRAIRVTRGGLEPRMTANEAAVSHSPGSSYSTFYKGWFCPTLSTHLCTLWACVNTYTKPKVQCRILYCWQERCPFSPPSPPPPRSPHLIYDISFELIEYLRGDFLFQWL